MKTDRVRISAEGLAEQHGRSLERGRKSAIVTVETIEGMGEETKYDGHLGRRTTLAKGCAPLVLDFPFNTGTLPKLSPPHPEYRSLRAQFSCHGSPLFSLDHPLKNRALLEIITPADALVLESISQYSESLVSTLDLKGGTLVVVMAGTYITPILSIPSDFVCACLHPRMDPRAQASIVSTGRLGSCAFGTLRCSDFKLIVF